MQDLGCDFVGSSTKRRRVPEKVLIRFHNSGTPLISGSSGLPLDSILIDSDRSYTIGRTGGLCDFVFNHGTISRKHCQILFDSKTRKLYIFDGAITSPSACSSISIEEFRRRLAGIELEKENEDMDRLRIRVSLNGVYVNSVRVRKGKFQEISAGDEISFVCGKQGLCCKQFRVGFVIQEIAFVEGYNSISEDICRMALASASSGHSRGTYSSGKRSKRVFALREDEISSPVAGFSLLKHVDVLTRMNLLLSYCRHILSSEDPISCLRLSSISDSGTRKTPEASNLIGQAEHCEVQEKENNHFTDFVNKDKSHSCFPQIPGKNFYLNRLQFTAQESSASQQVVSLPQLLHPVESILQIFIATFTSDVSWFLSCCEIPSHMPVTIACHNTDRCWKSSPDARIAAPYTNYPNLSLVFPPFPEEIAFGKDRKNHGIACHHPKLFIIQREDSMRVVITSANLVARQWNDVTNTVWWQDFPRRRNPVYLSLFDKCGREEINCGLSSDFGAQLAGFVASLIIDVPSEAKWIVELTKYNFEGAAGHLVTSVPGIHSYRPSHQTESICFNPATQHNREFLGSVEASVVGVSYLFRAAKDAMGKQLKRLASYVSRSRENSMGMIEIVLRRTLNVPADPNAVSILVPNPDYDSKDDFVQLGFLPRNIAKWVSPLWDIGFFKFTGYVYRGEVLGAASRRSNQKMQLMLHVLQGDSILDIPKLIQPHHAIALCSLVASIQRCIGIWRLQEILDRYKWPESQESDFVYSSSSIGGSVNAEFLAAFSSAAGKKALQHFDSQESDPEWGCWSAKEEQKAPSIRILFPTIHRVKNSHKGASSSRRLLCFTEKTWQRLRYKNILHDAVPHPHDRVGHPMHIKVARRRFISSAKSSSFGWVYSGSHNFSAAAWGQTVGRSSSSSLGGIKLRVCNYELGIVFVFPPPHEGDNGSCLDDIVLPFVVPAPKYGPWDKPATGLAMKEALSETMEVSTSRPGETEAVEELGAEEEEEEEGTEEREVVAEEEKEEEKAYAEALWSQVDSSLSS